MIRVVAGASPAGRGTVAGEAPATTQNKLRYTRTMSERVEVTLLIPAKSSGHSLDNAVTEAHRFLADRFGEAFEIILIPNPVAVADGTIRRQSLHRLRSVCARARCPARREPGKGGAFAAASRSRAATGCSSPTRISRTTSISSIALRTRTGERRRVRHRQPAHADQSCSTSRCVYFRSRTGDTAWA